MTDDFVPADDYRTNNVGHYDRWGKRFYLIEIDPAFNVFNVVGRDGEYVMTVQRTQAGWQWYNGSARSRKPITAPGATGGRTDAFQAAVCSAAVRRKYDR